MRQQLSVLREMTDAGLGKRYGAFVEGRLVADLGIYRSGSLGRFNDVSTHRDFRRQGICSTLVHRASKTAFAEGVSRLVLVADQGSQAERIYRSLGFEMTEKEVGLQWVDPGLVG